MRNFLLNLLGVALCAVLGMALGLLIFAVALVRALVP